MILVTGSILFVENITINTLLFVANLSLIFIIYYKFQNSLQVETSATFYDLSASF